MRSARLSRLACSRKATNHQTDLGQTAPQKQNPDLTFSLDPGRTHQPKTAIAHRTEYSAATLGQHCPLHQNLPSRAGYRPHPIAVQNTFLHRDPGALLSQLPTLKMSPRTTLGPNLSRDSSDQGPSSALRQPRFVFGKARGESLPARVTTLEYPIAQYLAVYGLNSLSDYRLVATTQISCRLCTGHFQHPGCRW